MSDGIVHVSTTRPDSPQDADFAIYIGFQKGEGNPARVFQAADAMIRAFQRLDHTLVGSINNDIEPTLVLEEIEAGSLKIWLRNVLTATDDAALKGLDWKQQVGKYLVKAKYVYIDWANRTDPSVTISDLSRNLLTIAKETDVSHMDIYTPPSIRELTDATSEMDKAKSYLIPGDSMSYLPAIQDGPVEPIAFNLLVRWDPEELLALARKETIRYENMAMNLIVKRPDYLGASMWDFRHGKKALSAKIDDEPWLRSFQSRAVDVRPGDALRCLVTLETSYGYDNELIDETFVVTKVEGVLSNQTRQRSLFDPDPDPIP